jgi:asparagine synthase (glutamine-hydrolysing)
VSVVAALAAPGAGAASAGPVPMSDGGERTVEWRDRHVALVLRSHDWEDALGGPPLHESPSVVVAADAAVHHRADLARRLAPRGVTPTGDGAAALVAAAYAAWEDGAPAELEGDVAFVLVDRRRGRLLAARDFVGRRPLYFAHAGGRLAVASSPAAAATRLGLDRRLNVAHLAGRAAGLLEAWDTAYEGVAPLPAGHTLTCELRADGGTGTPVLRRHWTPPTFERPGAPFEEAAAELRQALRDAVAERLDPEGATAVWLSGGYDSPAVYGVGQALLRERGGPAGLLAVSMSYPPGDAGREDELIAATVRHWDGRVVWRQVDDAPLFGDGGACRAGPFAHAFEGWMSSLAAAARDGGARVVLDGSGGDQLFQLSPVYLADLVRAGRWGEARAEWAAQGLRGGGWRRFARAGVLPLLPAPAWWAASLLRGGRPVRGLRAGVAPSWIRPAWRGALADRAELRLARRRGESEGARESRWYFETSYSATVLAEQRAIARRAGVEVRSPLLDGRVVALAATRPRAERAGGGETKRLLRRAVRGLLPEELLAPRRSRTGVTSHYFRRAMLRELPAVVTSVMEESVLADLGVIDPGEYQSAAARFRRGADAELGAALFATAQTELWLRAHG